MTEPRIFPLCMRLALVCALAIFAATGCADKPSKEEQEAAKNTFACTLAGERLVVRFDAGEARLLMPGGERAGRYSASHFMTVRS